MPSWWLAALGLLGAVTAALAAAPARAAPDSAELECLALNIYWEARAEDLEDKVAVAFVTLNRVASEDFPDTICAVVRQGGQDELHKCQFSWWCDGKPDTPANQEAWRDAQAVARGTLAGRHGDPTDGALYFHHVSVYPDWASRAVRTAAIGQHLFYR